MMTKTQKLILLVLAVTAVLLGVLAAVSDRVSREEKDVPSLPSSTIEVIDLHVIPETTPEPVPFPGGGYEPNPDHSINGTAGPVANPIDVPTMRKGTAFTLTINGCSIPVAYGVDEETLEKSPGWLTTSAEPGQEGVCVVYGHRNRNHLKALKDVDHGDVIKATNASGKTFEYRVESIEILDNETELRIPAFSDQHLLLSTCYPFYYTGHAPKKYLIMAFRQKER